MTALNQGAQGLDRSSSGDQGRLESLGPFPLHPEQLTSQLESLLRGLAQCLFRIRTGSSTIETENTALEATPPAPDQTRLTVVLSRREGGLHLEGIWISVRADYVLLDWQMADGEPPFVRALVEAFTQQLWWELLSGHVTQDAFCPLLVLEWPPELSLRGGMHGSGFVTLVRLELERRRSRHRSLFRLVSSAELVHAGADSSTLDLQIGLEAWWTLARDLPREARSPSQQTDVTIRVTSLKNELLALEEGWLSPTLQALPHRGQDSQSLFRSQALRVHGLNSLRRARAVNALLILLFSFLLSTLALVTLEQITRIRTEQEAVKMRPAPLPALSFCSEDNRHFVLGLRNWIERLLPTQPESVADHPGDLTAAWCGLLDRQHDSGWNAGLQAAANACLEILETRSYVYPEERLPRAAQPGWGDPYAFFENERTAVPALRNLVQQMRQTCQRYVRLQETEMKHAIVRAHLSPELTQVHPTLEAASDSAPRARPGVVPPIWTRLERSGEGVGRADVAGDAIPRLDSSTWLASYTDARFAPYPVAREQVPLFREPPLRRLPTDPLWGCWLSLQTSSMYKRLWGRAREGLPAQLAAWNVIWPFPEWLEAEDGRIRSQLELDAILRSLTLGETTEELRNSSGMLCWAVVREALDRQGYQPVHPLIQAKLDPWPAPEQQVCSQVCQAWFGLQFGKLRLEPAAAERWYTAEQDLQACLEADRFRHLPNSPELAALNLEMRWSGQTEASAAQACSFHLLAQDRFPMVGDKRLSPLGDIPPRQWVGGEGPSGVVDAKQSFLVGYAQALADPGGRGSDALLTRSVEGCQYVAAQCLTTSLLKLLERLSASQDGRRWTADLSLRLNDEIARSTRSDPWCRLIGSELSWLLQNDFRLSERRAEDICLGRIIESHGRVRAVLELLAREE